MHPVINSHVVIIQEPTIACISIGVDQGNILLQSLVVAL